MKKYKKEDLENLTADDFYAFTNVVAKNLSAIYKLFGWDMNFEWLKHEDEPQRTIDMLINSCLDYLREGEKGRINYATGGMKIEMWIDDFDEVCLEVFYCVGEW